MKNCDFDILCYADNTALIISNFSIDYTIIDACSVAHKVTKTIEFLELRVAAHKTEAILFPPVGNNGKYDRQNFIKNTAIKLSSEMKYLGITLDSSWSFTPHFTNIYDKVNITIDYLCAPQHAKYTRTQSA